MFSRRSLLVLALLWSSANAFIIAPGVNSLPAARPHNVVINVAEIQRRDSPAEIEVLDSDTVPVEDSSVGVKSADRASQSLSDSLMETSVSSVATDDGPHKKHASDESSFLMSVSMIVVSEIGDKTFLISALMAMRHSRMLVFSASFASLALMTVLSGVVGHALPSLVSQRVTQFLAAILFVIFGIKLTKEGLEMSKDLGVEEELAEVEEEIAVSDKNLEMDSLESGRSSSSSSAAVGSNSAYTKSSSSSYKKALSQFAGQLQGIAAHVLSPLWVQVFAMVFLGEWGDRSQIATIAMAAGSDYWGVIAGAVIGHGICTFAAVVGGKMLASKISLRTVTLGGAFAFFIFAILYFYDAFYGTSDS